MIGLVEGSSKAFFFDRGVWLFCNKIEVEMSIAESNAKDAKFASAARKRVLDKYLTDQVKSKKFKDPGAVSTKKAEPTESNLGSDFFG